MSFTTINTIQPFLMMFRDDDDDDGGGGNDITLKIYL
jgi:hypothetical protein